MMTYQEAVAYLYEIPKFTKKHSVEQTKEFLRRLGNPEKGQKIIHVAGTNGKGSVCAYMQAMLTAEGKRVGFFTSPHLVFVNERIRINNRQIDDETFLRIFLKVKETVDGTHNICKIILSDRWLFETKAKVVLEDDLVIYEESENVSEILKAMNFRVDLEGLSAHEAIYEQMNLIETVSKNQLYVLVNAKAFFSMEELRQLYDMAAYRKMRLLLMEASVSYIIKDYEAVTVFDNDLCEIKLAKEEDIV